MSDTDTSRCTFLALTAAAPAALALGGMASAQTSETGPGALPAAGRAAVVTGSSRGIGAATARRLAKDGYAVTVNYLTNADLAAQVVARHHGYRPLRRDDRWSFRPDDGDQCEGQFQRVARGGAAARRPPAYGPYAATKAVQEAYSGSLAKELGRRGIAVVPIAPGAVSTTLFTGGRSQEFVQGIINQTPFQRLAEPEDIANAIAALCMGDLHWINTGQPIHANGGLG